MAGIFISSKEIMALEGCGYDAASKKKRKFIQEMNGGSSLTVVQYACCTGSSPITVYTFINGKMPPKSLAAAFDIELNEIRSKPLKTDENHC